MKHLWLVFVMLLCGSTLTQAQTQEYPNTSGNAFVRLCSATLTDHTTQVELGHIMACLGYVSGFVDGVVAGNGFAEGVTTRKVPEPFCRPDNVENGQLIKIVLKYIDNHPERAHLPTGALIMYALYEALPCPK